MKIGQNKKLKKWVVGIDEVGRGPIAGPIAVCAFILLDKKEINKLSWIKDSKKMKESMRENAYKVMKQLKRKGKVNYAVSMRDNEFIDKWGIEKATRSSIKSCLNKLRLNPNKIFVKLDGRLYAPKEYKQETIVRGDNRVKMISCASVVAKVSRDRLMRKLSLKHPGYKFDKNKGYGSKLHYKAIKKYGITDLHRRSFLVQL